jgi:hypothetical protein
MNAKHQFKYSYTDTDLPEYSPVDVIFDMPGDVTITQMLWNFECYLKACGFVFDGHLEVVSEDGYDVINDSNYGYMGDVGINTNCYGKEYIPSHEVQKQKWVQGMCNPPSPDWNKSDSDNCWNS